MTWSRMSGITMMSSERPNRLRGNARLIKLRCCRAAAGMAPGSAAASFATMPPSIGLEDISRPSPRLDIARKFRIRLDVAAQSRHLHVDGADIAAELRLLGERLARDRLAGPAHERAQEAGFRRRQAHRLLAAKQLAALEVEAKDAKTHMTMQLGCGERHALQDVADAQHQLARLEWLGEIVVGAALEPGDAVAGLGHGGEQQDRRAQRLAPDLRFAQRAGGVEAGLPRPHDIAHDEIEPQACQLAARLGGGP